MLRDIRSAARALLPAIVAAVLLAGCGIKGPLVPPPKPESSKSEATKPEPPKPAGDATAPRKP